LEIRYECRYDELVDIGKIQRNPCNPNKHSVEQIQRLARVIERNGWRNPLVVSKRSGYLVKGEGRLLASISLDLDVVPVEYQDYATDDEEWSDLIADNKMSELSVQDRETLKEIVSKMDTTDYSATGFSQNEIDSLMDCMKMSADYYQSGNTQDTISVGSYPSNPISISYIDDLVNEELGNRENALSTVFTVSFCFDNKYSALKEYIKENGKEELEKAILEKASVI
jgi:hypothetical protein